MYVTVDQAKEEVWRRWHDEKLRRRVEEYLGGDIPPFFQQEPRAVLFRNVMIPDTELNRFLDLAHAIGLKPLGLEYLEDQFCTRNADKLRLGRIDIFEKMNKKNQPIIRCERIIDFIENDNKRLADVATVWGQNLVDLYHALLEENGRVPEYHDFSGWIGRNGGSAAHYYRKIFAIFMRHGVLFENFMACGEETSFCQRVVYPALADVSRAFGMNPLVMRIFSEEEIAHCDQWYFPAAVWERLKEIAAGERRR